ncbi:MAG TPA: tol-pal system protein YbgF [Thermoanaerobaculia bacterium]|nr:tol-pal system protein YbgF [Thermoanaerobaculia bacterium]
MSSRNSCTLLLAFLLAGCASNPFRSKNPAPSELETLKAKVLALEQQVTEHEVEINGLRTEVARLGAAKSGAQIGGAPPKAAAPAAPTDPSGRLNDGVKPNSTKGGIEVRELTPTPPAAASPGPAPHDQEALSGEMQDLYDHGLALYQDRQFAESEAVFQQFLNRYPNTELTDNAAYWIGESRYARQDWRGALAAFQNAVERQPQGNKVPDSLLKAGKCLERLGDIQGAKDLYDEVIRRFPGSSAATTAEERRSALP